MEMTWLRLDNAAKLYPAKMSPYDTCVFRVYAVLTEPIVPAVLQQSANDLAPRFPTFYVKLRNGFFWNYYEPNTRPLVVRPENGELCGLLDGRSNHDYLFSVQYDQCRITVETFHALGDGSAAITYLTALVYRYLTLLGHTIDPMGRVATLEQEPSSAEMEDSYEKYYTGAQKRATSRGNAYCIKGTPFVLPNQYRVLHGTMDSTKLTDVAHRYHTTVTKYLTALLIQSIWLAGENDSDRLTQPICINIPVNMRNILPSQTLRNFSLFFTARMEAMDTLRPFTEILARVDREFSRHTRLPALQRLLNANVFIQKSKLISCLPLPIKQLAIAVVSRTITNNHLTSSLSNVGQVHLPDGMVPFVQRYGLLPPLGRDMPLASTVISACGKTEITFMQKIEETDVVRCFFRAMVADGIPVTLTTNMPQ